MGIYVHLNDTRKGEDTSTLAIPSTQFELWD